MTPCPTCKKPVAAESEAFPFCHARCKLIDLGSWLSGRYVVSSPLSFDESESGDSGNAAGQSGEDETAADDLAARGSRTRRNAS